MLEQNTLLASSRLPGSLLNEIGESGAGATTYTLVECLRPRVFVDAKVNSPSIQVVMWVVVQTYLLELFLNKRKPPATMKYSGTNYFGRYIIFPRLLFAVEACVDIVHLFHTRCLHCQRSCERRRPHWPIRGTTP